MSESTEKKPPPTGREIAKWENRLVDGVIAAKYDGDAGQLATLCSELLGRLRDLAVPEPSVEEKA